MKRRVRLVTQDGDSRELTVPSLKLTIRDGGRRFEHHHGTGLGADVAVYEEVRAVR